jgi:hypothetical protein
MIETVLGIIAGLVVLVALVAAWVVVTELRAKGKRDEINKNGQRLMAWIVPTSVLEMTNFYLVMVIFSFDESTFGRPGFLEEVAKRMMSLTGKEDSFIEREVRRWVREMDSFELLTYRLRLPDSLTGGRTVYCTKTYAKKELLPGRRLTYPYIYVKVHPNIHDLKAEMVAYPLNNG